MSQERNGISAVEARTDEETIMRFALIAAVAALPLAACGDTTEPAPEPADTVADATPLEPTPDATTTPPPGETTDPRTIPAAIQGRWGLTEADCEPGRADAKGLLTISGDRLEFYESVGTLDSIDEAGPNRIRADFDFTGEGMTWERDIALDLQDGGQTLVRREYGEGAAADAFSYSKCP
jgi:hypothetical protein